MVVSGDLSVITVAPVALINPRELYAQNAL